MKLVMPVAKKTTVSTDVGMSNHWARSTSTSVTDRSCVKVVAVPASDGFISIERFESLTQEGKILSLSFWRDEDAIRRWRTLEAHRAAQARGRSSIFANYRLRVAEVVRDYGLNERHQAPKDSRDAHGA